MEAHLRVERVDGGMQPASPGNRGRRRGQVKIVREASRFGRDWWAKFPNLLKPWEIIQLSRLPVLGYGSRTIKVIGDVARTQWQTTLTDENPTSSRGSRFRPRASRVTPSYKSKTKSAAKATERHGDIRPRAVWGWQRLRSIRRRLARGPSEKGGTVGKDGGSTQIWRKLARSLKPLTVGPFLLRVNGRSLRNVSQHWNASRDPMKIVPRKFEKENREAEGP